MKKWLVLFLCAAVLYGCEGGDDETVVQGSSQGGSQGGSDEDDGGGTQQPVAPGEILSRRIVSVDVTIPGETPYTVAFSYDDQGRLTDYQDVWGSKDFSGSSVQLNGSTRFTYDGNTVSAVYMYSEVASDRCTYWLENGRVVRYRYEEDFWWSEAVCGYDADGYLSSLLFTFSDGDAETVNYTYTDTGFTESWKMPDEAYACTVEYDSAQLNNLNLDLYGWEGLCEELVEFWAGSRLLEAAGQRLRYLPAKISSVYTYEEDGRQYTETGVTSFVYRMDGEYLSEAEVWADGERCTSLVFCYEE